VAGVQDYGPRDDVVSRESEDDTIPSAETSSLEAPLISSQTPAVSPTDRLTRPASPPAQCLTDNDLARATNVNVHRRSSLSAALPQLHGFFNQKISNQQESPPGSSTKRSRSSRRTFLPFLFLDLFCVLVLCHRWQLLQLGSASPANVPLIAPYYCHK